MAKKEISISDVSDGSNINVTGGKKIIGLHGGQFTGLDKNTDDISVQISKIKGSIVNLIAEDEIVFSKNNFQEALSSFENILFKYLDTSQNAEYKEILSNIKTETQRSKPDFGKLKGYFDSLLTIIGLLKIDPSIIETLKNFILTILSKIVL